MILLFVFKLGYCSSTDIAWCILETNVGLDSPLLGSQTPVLLERVFAFAALIVFVVSPNSCQSRKTKKTRFAAFP